MVFKIRNMACRYANGPVVLRVPELDIARGELVFIIGASGIGKSTFLEALGLMNKTIAQDSEMTEQLDIRFLPQDEAQIPLDNIWDQSKDHLAELRNRYFSFIFQQTNLMQHFSVGENMMMSRLVAGSTRQEAEKEVRKVMKALSLDNNLFDKRVVEVSGGQRQRLAFVRAFTAPFEVLFADEPTGNLDPVTSRKLLQTLKDNIKGTEQKEAGQVVPDIAPKIKTGILVSHDIRLALDFADRIIPIIAVGEGRDKHGLLERKEILIREGENWIKEHDRSRLADPFQFLWQHLSNQL